LDLINKSGTILKGIGGFYYVSTDIGIIECRARGLFRKQNITPLVGDSVLIQSVDEVNKTGMIFEIFPRKNLLKRPAVANVDTLVAVISTENPRPNLYLLDKVIASAERMKIEVVIVINKTDLSDGQEFFEIYKNAGFDVFKISALDGCGIDLLQSAIQGKISVFAGNSGVGKSSIINILLDEDVFEVGEVSKKAERGRHTTRHSELRKLPFGGYIIDTPGFGSFEVTPDETENLSDFFREFSNFSGNCQFLDCRHYKEKGCSVIEAVNENKISKSRYDSYCSMIDEALNDKKKK